ncbi:MAG TPA: peptidoglycan DD-metalloendopeptidase family protein [Flavobacteriaceae bacterium]|nr:peptidoglycan DD-metalloendopeptidase family protein [Flavobacteriaceae bacterium]MCB9211888.1 peptidoglycan DD-metalloendopeptidase family protein [Alteromonas sp.]HPF10018.1 peptidoglycan DD-metalloendopeptidase family protein [Flavobacteriaceae bacterium]HQU22342.1 peptidoglycan DD-metalloendopeptidase family protein [Flavobacteriaceae bacterium]HQU63899.1 peptidoglycan DD-metalloendopeptidase family protein [Flavobacteriaceae bacterium]
MKQFRFLLFFIAFLGLSMGTFGQSKKQRELEEKRQALLEEIEKINALLFKTKGEKKSVLAEVEDLDQRIATRENLIRVTNQQANLLTREINANLNNIDQLKTELSQLKDDYAAMIQKSYKSRSQQSRVMFLLSSENFLQAYKRLQYMKQYTKFRKRQGEEIKTKTTELQRLNEALIQQKKDKEKLIAENKAEKRKLDEEKVAQQALVASLKKEEGKFAAQIRDKQKEANRLEKEIEALIKAAIAESNKAAGNKTTATTSNVFALTPEAVELAKDFKNNKGKLIWPVEKGKVITPFGKRQHPQFPNVTENHNGVEIITEPNAQARAVFEGEVMQVQQLKGANKAVYIRHGNYITIYNNLATVLVKKGDKVKTKQPIGTVFTHPTTGRAVLKFFVYQNTQKMNPADWIYKM